MMSIACTRCETSTVGIFTVGYDGAWRASVNVNTRTLPPDRRLKYWAGTTGCAKKRHFEKGKSRAGSYSLLLLAHGDFNSRQINCC